MRYRIFTPECVLGVALLVFITPMCGWVFKCGCVHLWAGAATHCNINDDSLPDCPWCATPPFCDDCENVSTLFQLLPAAGIYLSSWMTIKAARFYLGRSYIRELTIGFVALVIAFLFFAWLYKNLTHYPYFLN